MALPVSQGKTLPDAWDYKGRPAERSKTGGGISAAMILGGEAVERLTTLGIAVNLITYLTETMHLSNAASANIVTNFIGTSFMLCLLGGFVADTFLGRYLTIAIFAAVQATGVTILTISTIFPRLRPPKCPNVTGSGCIPASGLQMGILYLALYLTALGTGGLKSSVSGFGSDQFDETDEREKAQMHVFFNWFFFFISLGSFGAVTVLIYIQDDVGRKYGYGLCACAIVMALCVFLSGTRRYRFKKLAGSPLTQVAAVFVAAWRKRRLEAPEDASALCDIDDIPVEGKKKMKQKLPHSKQFLFLDKAAVRDPQNASDVSNKWSLQTLTDVEEVKQVIRMLPIWATTILFWTVHAQMTTFSVSQSATMNRHIGSFNIPPATMTGFFVASTLLTVPFYDHVIVPIGEKLFNNPHGLTPLQRIGIGLVLGVLGMAAAALTEIKRLHAVHGHMASGSKSQETPLRVFWLVPQFVFVGSGEAFTYIGELAFFLKECPKGMKTICTGLFLSSLAVGFFFSSLLVSIVNTVTGPRKPWLANNINEGKLYDFYWLVAILCCVNFLIFVYVSRRYVYKEKRLAETGCVVEEKDEIIGH